MALDRRQVEDDLLEGRQSFLTGGKAVIHGLDMSALGPMAFSSLVADMFPNITCLILSNNELYTVPPAVLALRELRRLDLSNNAIAEVPPDIGMLRQLRTLDLSDNRIEVLPIDMGRLFRLKQLELSGNPLVFPEPDILEQGTRATVLHLLDQILEQLPEISERQWIMSSSATPEQSGIDIRAMTFNILSEQFATEEMYWYCLPADLETTTRHMRAIEEIVSLGPDIVCLQEVESRRYKDTFQPNLSLHGYAGAYKPRSKARTMSMGEWSNVDGCAIFYKAKRLRLMREHLVEYQAIAGERFKDSPCKRDESFTRLYSKDNIALLCLFEVLGSSANGGKPVYVIAANTHIHWDPKNADVKLLQVQFLLEEVTKFKQAVQNELRAKIPVMICGDFNITPTSAVYTLLSKGYVAAGNKEMGTSNFGKYTTDGLSHTLNLGSAYAMAGGEPEYTNFSADFVGVLDYIWVERSCVKTQQVLGMVPLDDLPCPLPNHASCSDHVCIVADLRVDRS